MADQLKGTESAPVSSLSTNGVRKKTQALWKKQIKNLKLKDVGKKIEGVRYCAHDELFFREPEVLPLLMTFLTRIKMPEVIAETLEVLSVLLTPSAPVETPVIEDVTEPPPRVCHPEENARFILEKSRSSDSAWKGGEPLITLTTAAVSPEIKTRAIQVYTLLLEFCTRLSSSLEAPELLQQFQTVATPTTTLLGCLKEDQPIELQQAALTCLSLLFQDPPDAEYLTSFHTANGLSDILRYASLSDAYRLHQLMLEIVETFSRCECGREILRTSEAPVALQSLLSRILEVITTTISTATSTPTAPISLPAEDASRLHTAVPIICRSFTRILCAKDATDSDVVVSPDCVSEAIVAMIALTLREFNAAIAAATAASSPAAPVPSNAAAAAAAAALATTQTALASMFPFSLDRCVCMLSSIGRIIERNEEYKLVAKEKGLMRLLFLAFRGSEDEKLHQTVDKLLQLCAVVDVVVNKGSDTSRYVEHHVDPWIFNIVTRDIAVDGQDEPQKHERSALLTPDIVVSLLEGKVGNVDAHGVIYRIVRWLAVVVEDVENAKALGESVAAVLVRIILSTSSKETLLNGFLCKCLQAIAHQSSAACELCGVDDRNPISFIVTFLQTAYPAVQAHQSNRYQSFNSACEDEPDEDNASVHPCTSRSVIETNRTPRSSYKLEWIDEHDERDVFDAIPLTESREAIDPYALAAHTLETLATTFERWRGNGESSSSVDFSELLMQRLEAASTKETTPPPQLNSKKKTETRITCVGETTVTSMLEATASLIRILPKFPSVNGEVVIALLHVLRALAVLPGGVQALLMVAKTAISPLNPSDDETETPIQPMNWPLAVEECVRSEYAWLLTPMLDILKTHSTCFSQIRAAIDVLDAMTIEHESLDASSQEIASNHTERFINTALCSGALVSLIAVLDDMRLPKCPDETIPRDEFAESVRKVALRFISVGTKKQEAAEAKREALLAAYHEQQAAVAAAAANAKSTKGEPVVEPPVFDTQPIEFKKRWATELLQSKFDAMRFGYRRYPALLLATETAQYEVAVALLRAGVDPEAASITGTSPLMDALLTRNEALVQSLLATGADVDAITRDGFDLSIWCCAMAAPVRDDVTRLVTRAHTTRKNPLPLDIILELDHVEGSPIPVLQDLLAKTKIDVNVSNANGNFVLHALVSTLVVRKSIRSVPVCLRYNSQRVEPEVLLSLVKDMIETHQVALDACNKLGQTPLHLALLYGHAEIARDLLERGANPNIQDGFGCLPLHYACLGFFNDEAMALSVVHALLQGADRFSQRVGTHEDRRKFKSRQDKAALDIEGVLDRGYVELTAPPAIALTLSSAEQVLMTRSEGQGYLPWHFTCGACTHLNAGGRLCLDDDMNRRFIKNGDIRAAILRYLLANYGVKLDTPASKGLTGLHLAAKTDVGGSNASVLDILLAASEIPLNALHEPTLIDAPFPIPVGSMCEILSSETLRVSQGYISSRTLDEKYHVILPDGTHLTNLERRQLKATTSTLAYLQGTAQTSSNTRLRGVVASKYVMRVESAFSALHYALQASDELSLRLLSLSSISLNHEGSDIPLLALACVARRSAEVVSRLVTPQVNVRVDLPLHNGQVRDCDEIPDGPSTAGLNTGRRAGRKQAAALHYAVIYEATDVVRALVTRKEHTNVNVRRSGDGFTPLHLACEMGDMDIVKILLDHGANLIQMSTVSSASNGVTPLHLLLKADERENAKVKVLVAGRHLTREQLLEGLGAPAPSMTATKSDEARPGSSTDVRNSGRASPHADDEDEEEFEVSCVLLDEEEHNLTLFTLLEQATQSGRPMGYRRRLEMELAKSDEVLKIFFRLINGAKRTSKRPSITHDVVIPESDCVELDLCEEESAIDPEMIMAQEQFKQLKHWHACYAEQTVRSEWVDPAVLLNQELYRRRSSFNRRSTTALLEEMERLKEASATS